MKEAIKELEKMYSEMEKLEQKNDEKSIEKLGSITQSIYEMEVEMNLGLWDEN